MQKDTGIYIMAKGVFFQACYSKENFKPRLCTIFAHQLAKSIFVVSKVTKAKRDTYFLFCRS